MRTSGFDHRKVFSLQLNDELLIQHRLLSDAPFAVAVYPLLSLNLHQINQHDDMGSSCFDFINEVIAGGIHFISTGLLTSVESADQRYRVDTETMSRRLNMLLNLLRTESEFKNLPFSLFIGSHALKYCILSIRRNPRAVEALVCLCDDQTNPTDIQAVYRLRIPVLFVGHADNHPGAPHCISNYEADSGRKISDWLYRQVVRGHMLKNPEQRNSKSRLNYA